MKQLKLTHARKVLALIVLGAIATVFAGTALATIGSGFKERTVVARGKLSPQFKITGNALRLEPLRPTNRNVEGRHADLRRAARSADRNPRTRPRARPRPCDTAKHSRRHHGLWLVEPRSGPDADPLGL